MRLAVLRPTDGFRKIDGRKKCRIGIGQDGTGSIAGRFGKLGLLAAARKRDGERYGRDGCESLHGLSYPVFIFRERASRGISAKLSVTASPPRLCAGCGV